MSEQKPTSTMAIFIQARMTSQRLPGKVLRPLHGKPLIGYLLERLAAAPLPTIVLTSADASDDPLSDYCQQQGVACFRGSLHDVAGRFLAAAEAHGLAAFVRISGDSPLLDARLIAQGVALYEQAQPDLVTNVMPRTFPPGQSVEVVRVDALRTCFASPRPPEDHEHVTRCFYQQPQAHRIVNFAAPQDYSHLHMAIDTPAHWDAWAHALGQMTRPHTDYTWEEAVMLWPR